MIASEHITSTLLGLQNVLSFLGNYIWRNVTTILWKLNFVNVIHHYNHVIFIHISSMLTNSPEFLHNITIFHLIVWNNHLKISQFNPVCLRRVLTIYSKCHWITIFNMSPFPACLLIIISHIHCFSHFIHITVPRFTPSMFMECHHFFFSESPLWKYLNPACLRNVFMVTIIMKFHS